MATASHEEIERLAGRYSVLLRWSDEDNAYLVYLPEWAADVDMPATHGETRQKAVNSAGQVLEMLIGTDLKDGQPLPKPDVYVCVFKHDSDTSATAEGDGT